MSAGERTIIGTSLFAPAEGAADTSFKSAWITPSDYTQSTVQANTVTLGTLREYSTIAFRDLDTSIEDIDTRTTDTVNMRNATNIRLNNLEKSRTISVNKSLSSLGTGWYRVGTINNATFHIKKVRVNSVTNVANHSYGIWIKMGNPVIIQGQMSTPNQAVQMMDPANVNDGIVTVRGTQQAAVVSALSESIGAHSSSYDSDWRMNIIYPPNQPVVNATGVNNSSWFSEQDGVFLIGSQSSYMYTYGKFTLIEVGGSNRSWTVLVTQGTSNRHARVSVTENKV